MGLVSKLFLYLLSFYSLGQPAGIETSYLDPDKQSYPPNEHVKVCYEMQGWVGGVDCKLESLQVELGPGWDSLIPIDPPQNCSITTEGEWIWLDNGWHFEFGPSNGDPSDDPGDWDFFGDCIRSFCFFVQTKNVCDELNLSIVVTSRGDNINSICNSYHYSLYDGYIQPDEYCDIALYVPNSFTPNGDGSNDVFKTVGSGIIQFDLKIYNRWNQCVFESTDIERYWDGTNCTNDIYIYKIIYTNVLNETLQITGHINLIK